ncbi:hypothetical protein HY641_05130 [Candidatus Woesearchaeota archaeon]|nr:hypothetical protein [Candidatus Woesearchaeota archaeon]
MRKQGKISPIFLLDIIGFLTIVIAAVLARYASDPLLEIAAGLVGAIGVAILGIARFIGGPLW